jgi:hypothetical protein
LDFYYHINTTADGTPKEQNSDAGAAQSTPEISASKTVDSAVETEKSASEKIREGGSSVHVSSDKGLTSVEKIGDGCKVTNNDYKDANVCSDDSCSKSCPAQTESVTSFDSRQFASLLLQPRSLVLVKDDMYKIHLHGIKEVTHDVITDKVANVDAAEGVSVGDVLERKTRVSLTIRYVPKILKSKLIFGKR